jgi:hypothetical protein
MRIIEDKALLVETRDPDTITSVIKKSAVMESIAGRLRLLCTGGSRKPRRWLLWVTTYRRPCCGTMSGRVSLHPFAHQKTTSSFLTTQPQGILF